ECTLKNFLPNQTNFQGAEFLHTSLKGIDFTTCRIDGIRVSNKYQELTGMIVNTYQAAELSKLMGIIVREEI
ncbi:MAG: pentapeptide repeat-containing protein, partial [Thermotogota bacterium]|nr:pentapeptide repeat-containing protein [Thermotogota bacterium]